MVDLLFLKLVHLFLNILDVLGERFVLLMSVDQIPRDAYIITGQLRYFRTSGCYYLPSVSKAVNIAAPMTKAASVASMTAGPKSNGASSIV